MNGPAAKQLLEIIMLDDYVSRVAALKEWDAKWVATLDLVVKFDPPLNKRAEPEKTDAMKAGIKEITKSILHALRDESQHVTRFDYTDDMILMKVVFLRMEPQE